MPSENDLCLDFDNTDLLHVEAEIQDLIGARKVNNKLFLGINLAKLGRGPCLSIFKEIPSQRWMNGPDAFNAREEKTLEEILKQLKERSSIP